MMISGCVRMAKNVEYTDRFVKISLLSEKDKEKWKSHWKNEGYFWKLQDGTKVEVQKYGKSRFMLRRLF